MAVPGCLEKLIICPIRMIFEKHIADSVVFSCKQVVQDT